MTSTEVAIIGGGPVGIELAVALRKHGIDYLHFEAGQVGSTMFWWPPQTRWFSSNDRIAIAGVPLHTSDQGKATREDYLRYLRSVVAQFDLDIRTYEPVKSIRPVAGGFEVLTRPWRGQQAYRAGRIVLATGGTARPRLLGVPGEDLPHVSHYMQDPHRYFRRRVLVVGGRNSAVEAALRLHNVGARVDLSYRRAELDSRTIKYWLYPEIKALLNDGRINARFNTIVTRITPEQVQLAPCHADTFAALPGPGTQVPVDFVLLLVGYLADMSLARQAGVDLRGPGEVPAFDEQTMETNIPGLYIAGTATGGTQDRYRIFLENCHIHVDRIVAALTGQPPPQAPAPTAMPES
jgi:thioredoxin reductase (NADPH)